MLPSEEHPRTTPVPIKIEVCIHNLWAAEPLALYESLTARNEQRDLPNQTSQKPPGWDHVYVVIGG